MPWVWHKNVDNFQQYAQPAAYWTMSSEHPHCGFHSRVSEAVSLPKSWALGLEEKWMVMRTRANLVDKVASPRWDRLFPAVDKFPSRRFRLGSSKRFWQGKRWTFLWTLELVEIQLATCDDIIDARYLFGRRLVDRVRDLLIFVS